MYCECSNLQLHFQVRRGTADQLYATVVLYDDIIVDDVMEDAAAVLVDTPWWEVIFSKWKWSHDSLVCREGNVDHARQRRDQLCDLLDLPRPVLRVSKSCIYSLFTTSYGYAGNQRLCK